MLSLEEKIGQMLVVGFQGLQPPDYILEWLARGRIGGIILFARNVASPAQLADLTQACHAAAKHPILVAIDQEGGVVARLREGFTESPGAMALGAANSETLAEEVSAVLGAEMHAIGINWNLAPALDLTHNIHNPSVGVRSLGVDPQRAARLGVAQVRGFQKAGVAATAKHFPGKAKTPVDPHVSLPVIDEPLDDLWEVDLVPFRAVSEAGIASVMITHVQFKALEPEHPSTLSPRIMRDLLRKQVGFQGMITTDCMEMKAVTNKYGPGESAVLAALAGANIILFSHTREYQEAAHDAILDAAQAGRLPLDLIDQAVSKVQAVKERFPARRPDLTGTIRQPEHLAVVAEAARAGLVTLQSEPGVLPVKPDDPRRIALIEFASGLESEALEKGGQTGFATRVNQQLPRVEAVGIDPVTPVEGTATRARALAETAELTIVATRNAHLFPAQRALAQDLIGRGKRVILLCLRNPYDAGVLAGAGTILCTCGDSSPSLDAAVEVLVGHCVPSAQLPVPLTMD